MEFDNRFLDWRKSLFARKKSFFDENSYATNPGGVTLSDRKLRRLRPEFYGLSGWVKLLRARFGKGFDLRAYLAEHLQRGDSCAAVVVSVEPLLVAAYSIDFDCVAMLRFPPELVKSHRLAEGARLLTVNTYRVGGGFDEDLVPGPDCDSPWKGLRPVIADFLTDDAARLDERKREISEEEWDRTLLLGHEYMARFPGRTRDGRPMLCGLPAKLPSGR